jgi:hypothetical protein
MCALACVDALCYFLSGRAHLNAHTHVMCVFVLCAQACTGANTSRMHSLVALALQAAAEVPERPRVRIRACGTDPGPIGGAPWIALPLVHSPLSLAAQSACVRVCCVRVYVCTCVRVYVCVRGYACVVYVCVVNPSISFSLPFCCYMNECNITVSLCMCVL